MNAPIRINSALKVRDQFPAIENWHYLDSAATAQKPQAVIDAITQAYARDYATVHRGIYERSAVMTQSYEDARGGVKELLLVELADARAVRALHVVGVDLKFRFAIGGRAAVEQHRLDRLFAIGLLSAARHLDLAQI